VATVWSGDIGAVYCIEASRLASNGPDWHHLIELCARAGTLVMDPESALDPRIVNDRLLLGLKGTMSEFELSLMRQRGLAARDSKARRGEFRFMLPPGHCWNEAGKIEIDPDEHVQEAVRKVFAKFREPGNGRSVERVPVRLSGADQDSRASGIDSMRDGLDMGHGPCTTLASASKHTRHARVFRFGRCRRLYASHSSRGMSLVNETRASAAGPPRSGTVRPFSPRP
jgi:hypothetical protein